MVVSGAFPLLPAAAGQNKTICEIVTVKNTFHVQYMEKCDKL